MKKKLNNQDIFAHFFVSTTPDETSGVNVSLVRAVLSNLQVERIRVAPFVIFFHNPSPTSGYLGAPKAYGRNPKNNAVQRIETCWCFCRQARLSTFMGRSKDEKKKNCRKVFGISKRREEKNGRYKIDIKKNIR